MTEETNNMRQSMIHPTAVIDPQAKIGPVLKSDRMPLSGLMSPLVTEQKSWPTLRLTAGRRLVRTAGFSRAVLSVRNRRT